MPTEIEWVSEISRADEIAAAWDRLHVDDPLPYESMAWLRPWWDAFAGSDRLALAVGWSGGELVAALPLRRRRGQLRTLTNDHTPVCRPVARDAAVLEAFLRQVIAAVDGTLVLEALPAEDAGLAVALVEAQKGRLLALVGRHHTSPFVDTSGSLGDYRRDRRKHLGETERRRRKLVREHDLELRLIERLEAPEEILREGLELEARGWKGRSGTAILSSPRTTAFYLDVARRFQERGELRLSWLRLDGRMVAFDLALLVDGRYHLLKTAYDEALRRHGPGMVLRLAVVERCFELGLASHEFLGDDMPWKRAFSTGVREHRQLRLFRRRPVPVARWAYRRSVRPVLRRFRSRWQGAAERPEPVGSGRGRSARALLPRRQRHVG